MAMQREIDSIVRLGVLYPDGKHIGGPVRKELERRGFVPARLKRNGHLHIEVDNPPVTFIAQSSRDIPRLVDQGIYPLGIVGSDRLADYLVSASMVRHEPSIKELDCLEVFNPHVRVSLLVRNNDEDNGRYVRATDLRGHRIITSYPGLTSQFFKQYFPEVAEEIVLDGQASGKEEVQVYDYKAEGCVVIVDSGRTMKKWKLRELAVITSGDIQPVLIGNFKALQDRGSKILYEQFMDRFQNSGRSCRDLSDLTTASQVPLAS